MNVFLKEEIAKEYDGYYKTDFGMEVDRIEKEIIKSLLTDIPRGKMLELGCGTGHWTEFFIKEGFKVTGIDISETMLAEASKKNLKAKILKADSEKLPFANKSFETICSITMLEFIKNQETVFNEMYRILKPNGHLILGCLNAKSSLALNSQNDETFKNAKFFNATELKFNLSRFGKPNLNFGVYLSPEGKIVENSNEINQIEPIFMGAIVQKVSSRYSSDDFRQPALYSSDE